MALSISAITTLLVISITGVRATLPFNTIEQLETYKLSEDGKLNFTELAYKYGHSGEEFDVVTEDGYILKLFHIFGDPAHTVLLIHGNTVTADCWISRGNISLAITLADRGYDVWAINMRGSRFSRRHLYLDPDTQAKQFFNFTFYELGAYDLPPTIDLILNKTGQEQLVMIGHSVGTTSMYILGSERPEYNDKVKVSISLAPISYIQHLGGPVALLRYIGPGPLRLLNKLNIYEVAGYDQLAPFTLKYCLGKNGYHICVENGIFPQFGYDRPGLEPAFLPTLFGHYPGGSSVKTFKHLIQVLLSNRFAKYDYGEKRNLKVYNSAEPPLFDLSKITMKMALFVGRNDYLGSVADAERLRDQLPNVVHYQIMPYDQFNHGDFIWGRYMPENLYPYLLKVVEKYI